MKRIVNDVRLLQRQTNLGSVHIYCSLVFTGILVALPQCAANTTIITRDNRYRGVYPYLQII